MAERIWMKMRFFFIAECENSHRKVNELCNHEECEGTSIKEHAPTHSHTERKEKPNYETPNQNQMNVLKSAMPTNVTRPFHLVKRFSMPCYWNFKSFNHVKQEWMNLDLCQLGIQPSPKTQSIHEIYMNKQLKAC